MSEKDLSPSVFENTKAQGVTESPTETDLDEHASQQSASPFQSRWRTFFHSFSAVGVAFALSSFCASMTPSLIPRTWIVQAVISGLCMILGYSLGVLVSWVFRKLGFSPNWSALTRKRAWTALGLVALVSAPVMQTLGENWQKDLRRLFGMNNTVDTKHFLVLIIAFGVFLLFLIIARALRAAYRRLSRFFGRWIPRTVARVAAAVVVATISVLTFNGTIINGTMNLLDSIYSDLDQTTSAGVSRPLQPERTGSPASTLTWESLGKEGRNFVAGGPSQTELANFARTTTSDLTVQEPIRVYAGRAAANEYEVAAAQAVKELDRTDAWSREVLVVATTTGTGWVDPSMSDTIEFLHAGNTAIVAMQYSYLPSWISFVSGRNIPPTAGRIFFDTVHAAWSKQPAESRPKLLVFGESLGSYGGQGAFSSVEDLTNKTEGALWIGTPNFTPLWSGVTASRDPGSPQHSPIYKNGENLQWDSSVGSEQATWLSNVPWEEPRVVYVQHASDAVVWWSPDLIWHEPDWLRETRGPDVLNDFIWFPGVTFWQVTMDLFFAANVPAGYGHAYHLEYSDSWAAIAPPTDWTDADTVKLRNIMKGKPVTT